MKVLIFTAAAGGGHLRAAAALAEFLQRNMPQVQVRTADALKETNYLYDKVICGGYRFVATKTPSIFGRMYRKTNHDGPLAKLVPKMNDALGRRLLSVINEFEPDMIVATHPFAGEMTSHLKSKGLVQAKLLVLMTDYGPHKTWIAEQADGYLVACADMVEPMVRDFGVPREKIHSFGIPVPERFFDRGDKVVLRRELGLDANKMTVLLMAGSFGVKNIVQIYREIVRIPREFQMVVITGKNKRLYQTLQTTALLSPVFTRLLLFTEEVERYMHASDLLITKPGGLTVSEALASDLPMLVFDSIPGPEEDNASFLERNGMAKRLRKGESCAAALQTLLEHPEELTVMRDACSKFDTAQGCAQIAELMQLMTGMK